MKRALVPLAKSTFKTINRAEIRGTIIKICENNSFLVISIHTEFNEIECKLNCSDVDVKVRIGSPVYQAAKRCQKGDTLDIRGTISDDKNIVPIRFENLRLCHTGGNPVFKSFNRCEIRGPISFISPINGSVMLRVHTEEGATNGRIYHSNIDVRITADSPYCHDVAKSRVGDTVDVRGIMLTDKIISPRHFENFALCPSAGDTK